MQEVLFCVSSVLCRLISLEYAALVCVRHSEAVGSPQAISFLTRAGGGRRRSLAPFLASSPGQSEAAVWLSASNAPSGAWALPRDTANVCVCVCVCVAIRNLSISCPDCPHASHPQFTCWTHTLIIPPFSSALKKPRFILPCWRASFISGLHLSLYYLPV